MERNMKWCWPVALAFACGFLLSARCAAQTWHPCLQDDPFSSYITHKPVGIGGWPLDSEYPPPLTNGIISIVVGVSGSLSWGNDEDDTDDFTANTVEEGCWDPSITLDAGGRFSFGYEAGSPFTSVDNGCALTMGYPFPSGTFCYATIRVTDADGTTTDKVFGSTDGAWVLRPYQGASGLYVRALWSFNGPDVWVDLRIDVLNETWRFQWDFYNFEDSPVQIGMRFGQWCAFRRDDGQNMGNGSRRGFLTDTLYIMIPGARPIVVDFLADRGVLGTANMPAYFDLYWGQQDPYPSFRQWLKPDAQHPDLTIVDRIEHTEWERLLWYTWNGLLIPDMMIVAPAYAVFYNPINVRPSSGEINPDNPNAYGRRIVQYMSSANTSGDVSTPVAVSTECPRAVQFDSSGLNGFTPNPFKVYANIYNGYTDVNEEIDLKNVTVALALPPGLQIDPGDTLQKTISTISPRDTATVSWDVVATGEVSGTVTYRVLVSPPPADAKTVTNTVLLSAVDKLKVTNGYQLVTLPFEFGDTRFSQIFGVANLHTIGQDETTGGYLPIEVATRGRGFWFDPGEDATFTLLGATPPGNVTSDYKINLKPGWRMIGNPWLYPVPFGQLVFVGAEDPTKARSLAEAIGLGWIRGVLYYWDKALVEYRFTEDLGTDVQPMRGYWVKVTSREQLQVSWPPVFAPGVGGSPRAPVDLWVPRPGHFRLQVAARTGRGIDTQNFFGITDEGRVGLDKYDVPKPPEPPEPVIRVSIDHQDWGTDSGPYAQDIRPGSETTQTWEFAVTNYGDGEVTLTWPNLSSIPKQYGFRLTDLQSGISRNLRTVSAYTFRMSEGERKFRLEMFPASPSKVVISGMNISQSRAGGVTVHYSLNTDATTTVRVLGASGKVVQTVALNKSESRGVNTHVWNTRNAEGISMPPGTYIIEVCAMTPEGQVARVVRPHVLTR
jgi:hypothetical protein